MHVVPNQLQNKLSAALLHADKNGVIDIIERNALFANSIIDEGTSKSILHEAVSTLNEFHGSAAQIELIEYLLSKGADPNIRTSAQYNAFHVALNYHELSEVALLLLTKGNADVNVADDHGNTPLFIAIREYRLTWRPEQERVNRLRFRIIEELLKLGADLDAANMHGVSPRRWLELANDKKLNGLVAKYDI